MNARRSSSNSAPARLRFPLLPLLVALGATVLTIAGCPFNSHGTGTGGSGGEGETCNVDGDCNDKEPCTTDKCVESFCKHTPVDDGPLAKGQEVGDCKVIVCDAGESVTNDDDDDIPDDDNDCTIDSCNMGVASHVPKIPSGQSCTDAQGNTGRCTMQGKCEVPCTTAADCIADPPNPCVVPSCDTVDAVCDYPPVTDGTPTPGFTQAPGDCKVHICLGGFDTEQEDPADVNVTATDCDLEQCNAGMPVNPAIAEGSPCGTYNGSQSGFCDNAGACRQCAKDEDCGGRIDDCNYNGCINYVCGVKHDPANTATSGNPPQVVGDCQRIVCDGNGGTTLVQDGSDPQDDGNECKADSCNGITTVHTNVNDGTHCGTGGALACVGGACAGCTMDSQCPQAFCTGNILTKAQTCGGGDGTCDVAAQPTQDCAPYRCATGMPSACTTKCNVDTDCFQGGSIGNWCTGTNGSCNAKLGTGLSCSGDNQCQSGFCVDGVCCTTACTGGCQACSAAKKGSGSNGTCGTIEAGTDPDSECMNQGAASCGNDGFCDGAGACRKYQAGTICRPQNGLCDVAETCPGNGAACPADGFAPNSVVCRASAGPCDIAENCNGMSPSCPSNAFSPAVAVCRMAAGPCDNAENCTGSSATCPTDGFKASSTVCRAAADVCDQAENCTGSSANCPNDGFKSSSTVCRAQNGACDVAENCTGASVACPSDAFQPSSFTCRNANGSCDVAEKCTGSSPSCPNDGFADSSTVCRPANGSCDVAENCTGSSANCPNDAFADSSTVCRVATGVCDVAENCTGSSANCPNDLFRPSSFECRAANGECDVAENCSGSSGACPSDGVRPSSYECRPSAGACDKADTCDGTTKSCPADELQPIGHVCRSTSGACDAPETCDGMSTACPADEVLPSSTVCRAATLVCDAAENCDGSSKSCPTDLFVTLGNTDPPSCTGNNVCDGAGTGSGHCKLKANQPCNNPSECASGVCTSSLCVGP